MLHTEQLNKQTYAESMDTVMQREIRTSAICKYHYQAQNLGTVATVRSGRRIRKPDRLCYY